jgi:hypothetical protein
MISWFCSDPDIDFVRRTVLAARVVDRRKNIPLADQECASRRRITIMQLILRLVPTHLLSNFSYCRTADATRGPAFDSNQLSLVFPT